MSNIRNLTLAICFLLPTTAVLAEPAPPTPTGPAGQAIQLGAHLGVVVTPVPPPLAKQLPDTVAPGQGVMVMRIQADSPAARAGLRRFDVLTSYDDQRLFSPAQLAALTRLDQPGRAVALQVARTDGVETLTVTLGDGAPGGKMKKHASPHPHAEPHGQKQGKSGFSTFQSLSLERQEDGRFRAMITYQGPDGERHEHTFEGSRKEVRQQVMAAEDLARPAKRHLLKAMGMSSRKSAWHPRSYHGPHPRLHEAMRHMRHKWHRHCQER